MSEPADNPVRPLRTWRPMAAWTAGILLALGLAWFIGAVAVPVWRTRSFLTSDEEYEDGAAINQGRWNLIHRLGGPERAASQLNLYLRLPGWIAPEKPGVAATLEGCGKAGLPALAVCLKSRDLELRHAGLSTLRMIALGEGREDRATAAAVAALLAAELRPGDAPEDLAGIAETLGEIGPAAATGRPGLEGLLGHPDAKVRAAAADALKNIRGESAGN